MVYRSTGIRVGALALFLLVVMLCGWDTYRQQAISVPHTSANWAFSELSSAPHVRANWVATPSALHMGGELQDPLWNTTGNKRLFYNRVPKCASRFVAQILYRLADRLRYTVDAPAIFDPYNINQTEQRSLVNHINQLPPMSIYERHLHFINFTEYDERQPIYFNIIRDPVERAISQFYFQNEIIYKANMSLEECVSKKLNRCLSEQETHHLIPFFCGQSTFCRHSSMASLRMAQRNVEIHYAMVGFTEALLESLQLAEALLPDYFRGFMEIYTNNSAAFWKETKTSLKQPVSNDTRAILASHMPRDIEFYKWIKPHFFNLYKKHVKPLA